MKIFRNTLFWLHLVAGCVGGLVILLMSLTGVILTYERQMIASSERSDFTLVKPAHSARALPIDNLLQAANIKDSAMITLRSSPAEPIEINLGRNGILFVDPYSGGVLGSPSKTSREFFQKVRGWHRWLAWEGEYRAWGKAITGACTLAFLGLVLSGLYLWIPQVWSWRHLRPILWFRSGLSGKARDFNWHNAIGIWAAVPLFFVIISALPISYRWANDLIYIATGTSQPKVETPKLEKGEPNPEGLTRMLDVARSEEGWRSISFRYGSGEGPVTFTIDRGDGGQPQLKSSITLDRATAAIVKRESFSDYNLGRQVRMFSRFLHTGESLGLIGQTIAGLASAGGVVLVWTGLALAWRRFLNWRRRNRTQPAAEQIERETVAV